VAIYWKTGASELWRCWILVILSTKWGGASDAMQFGDALA
jgi:hypothetical protein